MQICCFYSYPQKWRKFIVINIIQDSSDDYNDHRHSPGVEGVHQEAYANLMLNQINGLCRWLRAWIWRRYRGIFTEPASNEVKSVELWPIILFVQSTKSYVTWKSCSETFAVRSSAECTGGQCTFIVIGHSVTIRPFDVVKVLQCTVSGYGIYLT